MGSAKTGQEGLAAFRLPKISFAIYDGTCFDGLGWWSQFETNYENPGISEVDKFRYLMQSIKQGTRAERLVRSYPLTKENYPKVIKVLKDRFCDSTILTEGYVRQLLKLVVNNVRRKILCLEIMYDQLETHLRSLESLGVNIQQNAYFLYPMVESSLPEDLLRTWQRSALAGYDLEDGELPPTVDKRLTSLLEFMRREVKREQRLGYIRDGLGESSRMRTNGHYVTKMHAAEVKSKTERVDPNCIICQGGHWIQRCPKWHAMPVTQRTGELRSLGACFNCLRLGHYARNFRRPNHYPRSRDRHSGFQQQPRTKPQNSLEKKMENTRLEDKVVQVNEQEVAYTGMHVRTAITKALLATALVRIMNNRGERMVVRVLLDQGSQSSFISRDVLQHLITTITRINAQVYGINDIKGELVRELASCRLESLTQPDQSIPHLVYHTSVKYEDSLEDILKRFWEVEKIPIKRRSSAEEEFCEQLYQSEVKRTRTGRYVVPLPLDPTIAESDLFGLSVAVCFRRQLAMERRLDRDVYLKGEYCSFMKDYEELADVPGFARGFTRVKLAKNDGHLYPKATEAIRRDTYVDDILTGAENSLEAMGLQRELIDLLRGGGFVLRKWASNDLALLKQIPEGDRLSKSSLKKLK
ncbi:hypothetical protein LAZ67_2005591 [Cordylochernes scorpioides]|uniref:Peptidase aspartic putative domain-containing protein n=1 Tax=Cordylochernes scorpioides TaxID=51811 RepID=A0ABY6K627_9ARAC|nr:hypothetical protein LAZ67_2005591 [Cordylochernes scorpioides]